MKAVEVKYPGVIDFYQSDKDDNLLTRREFIDQYDILELSANKKEIHSNKEVIKPVLEAGLFFFKELNIKGYHLEYRLSKNIPREYNLYRDDIVKASTIQSLNYIMGTNLSMDEIKELIGKLSINATLMMNNDSFIFDGNNKIINNNLNSQDMYYILLNLKMYDKEVLKDFFMKNKNIEINDEDIVRYKTLIEIKRILEEHQVNKMSINGDSNTLVASFDNVHNRFKAAELLKECDMKKYNRGHGYTLLRMNR